MKQMDRDARRRVLLSSPLFDAFPTDALDDLLLRATEKVLRRGQTLFHKGDDGSYMVAVLSGRMRISATSPEGKEITLNMIDAGEVFGEMALLDGKKRSADATAIEDSHLMMIERKNFLPYLMSNHDLALRLIDELCVRLRDTSETLGDLVMLDLAGRLARKLLSLAAEYGQPVPGGVRLEIKLSDTDLGRFIGAQRESVNRQMRAWEEDRIAGREDGRFVLYKPNVLRRIAGQD